MNVPIKKTRIPNIVDRIRRKDTSGVKVINKRKPVKRIVDFQNGWSMPGLKQAKQKQARVK